MNPLFDVSRSPVVTIGRTNWWRRLNTLTEEEGIMFVAATQQQCSSNCPNTTCKCKNATKVRGDLSGRRSQ